MHFSKVKVSDWASAFITGLTACLETDPLLLLQFFAQKKNNINLPSSSLYRC